MNNYRQRISAFLLLILAITSCSSHHHGKHDGSDQPSTPPYILYSPNGEPLNGGPLGKPTCQKAISGWFDRLGAPHNGTISREIFMNDAHIQFGRMDIDHNGYIVSEELDRFRAPYRQQPPSQNQAEQTDAEPKQGHGHKGSSGKGHGNGSGQTDATLFDPVMSADTNLDFKVTPDEFMKQAQDTFAKLDGNHDGFLDRTEIMTLCQQKK